MKLSIKEGESVRIKTDSDAPIMIYVDKGVVHVTAAPQGTHTLIVIADKNVPCVWR